jgi:hypothetical protein
MHARQLKRRAEPAVTWRWGVEGHSSCLKWFKPASQSLELCNRDARAGATRVDQTTIIGVVAEKQRADVGPASSRIGPADDDEFLSVETL